MVFQRRKRDRRRNQGTWIEHFITMAIVLLVCAVWVLVLVDIGRRIAP